MVTRKWALGKGNKIVANQLGNKPRTGCVCSLLLSLSLVWGCTDTDPGHELGERVGNRRPQPPILLDLPAFEFTNQDGKVFGSEQLRGKVWIANFIFTRCVLSCPVQTSHMAKLQQHLAQSAGWHDIALVSFSVDPEFDTPEVLTEYGTQYGADFAHWRFLTGHRSLIWDLSKNGFKLPVEERPMEVGLPLFHAPHLVLVDRQLRIRGFFNGMTEEEFEQISDDVERILKEAAAPDG